MMKLTDQHWAFIEAYLVTGNGTHAEQVAGFSEGYSQELLAKPEIQGALAALRRGIPENVAITLERLTRMALDAFELSKTGKDGGSMVRAVQALSKMHGFDQAKRPNSRGLLEVLSGMPDAVRDEEKVH